jgi:hypothetical protein
LKVIHKYPLPIADVVRVKMPSGAHPVRVDSINGLAYIWAMVDTDKPEVFHEYHMFKTGGKMPDDADTLIYIGQVAIYVQMELMLYVHQYAKNEFKDNFSTVGFWNE